MNLALQFPFLYRLYNLPYTCLIRGPLCAMAWSTRSDQIPNCTREHTLWPAHEGLPGTSSNVKLAKNIILFAYRYLLTLSEFVSCSYRPLQKWWDNGILTQQRKFQQPPWPHPITVNSCQILLWRRMLSACIGTKPSAMGDILGLVGTTRPKGKHLKYIRLYLPTNPFTLILNPPSF